MTGPMDPGADPTQWRVDPAEQPETTAAGDPLPILVRVEPTPPAETSYDRAVIGPGEGPRLPDSHEVVWIKYEQALADEARRMEGT